MKLIIASHNKGKIREFEQLLAPLGCEVTSLLDYPQLPEVEETGVTFEENARLKAESIAQQTNCLVLADDSGLVVPSLNGEPGVYSARYAGEQKNDQDNIDKLLAKLSDTSRSRQAYFVACLALVSPTKRSLVVEGRAYGEIIDTPRGDNGFGYDPIFYVESEQATFAQLSSQRKNELSHRANALKKLLEVLPEWLKEEHA